MALGVTVSVAFLWSPFLVRRGPYDTSFNLTLAQNVFILFYAIFWGYVSEVQPKWKAHHWTLFSSEPKIRRRIWMALVLFVCVPTAFFAFAFAAFDTPNDCYLSSVVLPLLAAQAPFGFYRIWIGIMESNPGQYYFTKAELDENKRWWLSLRPWWKEFKDYSSARRRGNPAASQEGVRSSLPVFAAEKAYDCPEGELFLDPVFADRNLWWGMVYVVLAGGAAILFLLPPFRLDRICFPWW